MVNIEKELKALGAKKHRPNETLRQRTVDVLNEAQKKFVPRKVLAVRWATVSLAAVVLAAVLMFAFLPGAPETSYFTIDINPSIGIETDANGTILSVTAQNNDAEELLADLNLYGMPFIDALRCVVQTAEEQGYLKDSGHVLVAHFGVTAQITEEQVETAVAESTRKQVNVLLLQSDKSDYKEASQTHQSAGISLLMRDAQQFGIEDVDVDTIIQTVKKNHNSAVSNGPSYGQPSPSATPGSTESEAQGNGNSNNPEKSNNGNNNNHGNSNSNNNSNNGNGNESSASHGNNSNNGNHGQSDKADKSDDNGDN